MAKTYTKTTWNKTKTRSKSVKVLAAEMAEVEPFPWHCDDCGAFIANCLDDVANHNVSHAEHRKMGGTKGPRAERINSHENIHKRCYNCHTENDTGSEVKTDFLR